MPIQLIFDPPMQEGVQAPDYLTLPSGDVKVLGFDGVCLTLAPFPREDIPKLINLLEGISGCKVTEGESLSFDREKPDYSEPAPVEAEAETKVDFESYLDNLIQLDTFREPVEEEEPPLPAPDMFKSPARIWDALFVKPPPVENRADWLSSPESGRFIYLPNELGKEPKVAEDAMTNAFYTQVLVNAYQSLCREIGQDPVVVLQGGLMKRKALSLSSFDGAQPHYPGEQSSGLANSTLESFDDSPYIAQFLSALERLPRDMVESGPIHATVMSKAEWLLTGERVHLGNHQISRGLIDLVASWIADPGHPLHGDTLLLKGMTGLLRQLYNEGVVLQDAKDLFISRLRNAQLHKYVRHVSEAYDQVARVL